MMKANADIKNYVYDGVVNEYAKLAGVSLRDAFDTLYKSRLYGQIRRGVSDMHCRSDGYLAEELLREQQNTARAKQAAP
ncbi:MAG: hypothetical protein LBK75_01565 [Oscillospiraceae bacterium]|jgi:hypothetical protein|nr:hypothetical protein [Oscillospiraceae bacterium]